ncbi:MAG: transcription-repair coupling factor, partial [Gammaproteobacteria bacterium]|nr:transcription-repair coupling factor [Gammaproteobacteria bacterium]
GTEIDLQIPALIPDDYVYDVHTRLTLYKRIANAGNKQELHELQVELVDRFGLLPAPTKNLFSITEMKLSTETAGIHTIKAGSTQGHIGFEPTANINPQNIIKLLQQAPNLYKFDTQTHKLKFTLAAKTAEQKIAAINKILGDVLN